MSTPEEDLEAFFTMHCGHLSAARRDYLHRQYVSTVAASEARGFERARKEAERRIANRCCAVMATHGFCEHQPCDYYHNALSEILAMQDETP